MRLTQNKILVKTTPLNSAVSFLIERFEVPEEFSSLAFMLEVPEYPIELLLVYDSSFNLRAEIRDICSKTQFVISEVAMQSTKGTKDGFLPKGEWIIAIQLGQQEHDSWHCTYLIEGYKNEN